MLCNSIDVTFVQRYLRLLVVKHKAEITILSSDFPKISLRRPCTDSAARRTSKRHPWQHITVLNLPQPKRLKMTQQHSLSPNGSRKNLTKQSKSPQRRWRTAPRHRLSNRRILSRCKSGDASQERAMNVGERRSNVMGSSRAHIVQSTVMVWVRGAPNCSSGNSQLNFFANSSNKNVHMINPRTEDEIRHPNISRPLRIGCKKLKHC